MEGGKRKENRGHGVEERKVIMKGEGQEGGGRGGRKEREEGRKDEGREGREGGKERKGRQGGKEVQRKGRRKEGTVKHATQNPCVHLTSRTCC